MREIQIVQEIYELLESLDPASRRRTLAWINDKYTDLFMNDAGLPPSPVLASMNADRKIGQPRAYEYRLVPEIDLDPEDEINACEFIRRNTPKNNKAKCLTSVYYLEKIIKVDHVSIDHVYTFFKHMSWGLPASLLNSLHQAGSDKYLITSDSSDIRVTEKGRDAIEKSGYHAAGIKRTIVLPRVDMASRSRHEDDA